MHPHYTSRFYDVPRFLRGKSTLLPIELKEVGPVRGRTLLHLMCHFGLDTLSWARHGALVTGVDFAPQAVSHARALAREAGIEATFVQSNIYDLPRKLSDDFDVVFTSYGVLWWLPDLDRWARVVARYVRPGGFFYLVDDHPLANSFEWNPRTRHLELRRSYFGTPVPTKEVFAGSYAVSSAGKLSPTFGWSHSVSDILNALLSVGLRVEFVHEFPFTAWRRYPPLRERKDGYFEMLRRYPSIPLLLSVRADRPAAAQPS